LKPPTLQREKSHFTFASYLPKKSLGKIKNFRVIVLQMEHGIHITTLDLDIAGIFVDAKIPLSPQDLCFQQGNPFFA